MEKDWSYVKNQNHVEIEEQGLLTVDQNKGWAGKDKQV